MGWNEKGNNWVLYSKDVIRCLEYPKIVFRSIWPIVRFVLKQTHACFGEKVSPDVFPSPHLTDRLHSPCGTAFVTHIVWRPYSHPQGYVWSVHVWSHGQIQEHIQTRNKCYLRSDLSSYIMYASKNKNTTWLASLTLLFCSLCFNSHELWTVWVRLRLQQHLFRVTYSHPSLLRHFVLANCSYFRVPCGEYNHQCVTLHYIAVQYTIIHLETLSELPESFVGLVAFMNQPSDIVFVEVH